MPVPKSRHTKSKKNRRRAHLYLEEPVLGRCRKCGKPCLSHRVCTYCGFYKGRMVIDVLAKLEKKERKARKKEIEAKEKEEGEKPETLDWKKMSKT